MHGFRLQMRRRLFVALAAPCALIVSALIVRSASAVQRGESTRPNVLILGDSLALCGFGKRLDQRFRNNEEFGAVYTYMACGTNPLSWLKEKPFTHVKTQCGFWTIEPASDGEPNELQDTYGKGSRPKAHPVPKLEELLATSQPEIVVVQTGSNLFGIFQDGKTVHPARDAATLRKYLRPFLEKLRSAGPSVKKVYWVNPPISGRVSSEVQDFVYQRVKEELSSVVTVIDSRPLVSYPYQHMEPDKEHFLGAQMDEWADDVYQIIEQDLSREPLSASVPLQESAPPEAQPAASATPAASTTREQSPVVVDAKLLFKTKPMSVKELLPYQEALTGFVYQVRRVRSGEYRDGEILVMHPSHVALKPQRLDRYKIGKTYRLRLQPMEKTLWETAKMRDDSGRIDLQPYILTDDLRRHPAQRK